MGETRSETDAFLEALDAHIRAIVAEEIDKRSPDYDEWLSIKQVKELAGLSEWHIRQLIEGGKLAVYQPNPGRSPLKICRRSLLELLSQESAIKKGSRK